VTMAGPLFLRICSNPVGGGGTEGEMDGRTAYPED